MMPKQIGSPGGLPRLPHNLTSGEPALALSTRDLNERQTHRLIKPSTREQRWRVSHKV